MEPSKTTEELVKDVVTEIVKLMKTVSESTIEQAKKKEKLPKKLKKLEIEVIE